jgi:predicted nucleic acid-binding Zn ribbon protein
MIFEYCCSACKENFEEWLTHAKKEEPISKPCPKCGVVGSITHVFGVPAISYQGAKTTLQRAGSGWNDLLGKIKKTSGKANTIKTK